MSDKALLGFIGVGTMGKAMASQLMARGHSVIVHDVSADAVAAMVKAGARGAASIRELADEATIVFTCLPGPAELTEVALGQGGVKDGKAVKVMVDFSTVGPRATKAVTAGLQKKGIDVVDAPVSGGVEGAARAKLTVMTAGKPSAMAEVRALLEIFGTVITVGEAPGQAQLLKLLNNMLSTTAFAITSEAFVAGVKGGLDPAVMMSVINVSTGRSGASQDKFMKQVLPRTFDFGAPMSIVSKDITLAIEECEALGVPMWIGNQVRQLWKFAAMEEGGAERDLTELVLLIEKWSNARPITVGSKKVD